MTVQLVGWALLHSLWQGALIAALLGITLAVLRKAPAGWRHLACLVALLAMLAIPLFTSARMVEQAPGTSATTPSLSNDITVDAPPATAGPETQQTSRVPDRSAPPEPVSLQRRFDVEAMFPWLVGFWLFGVLLLSLRVIGGYVRARTLVHTATEAVSADIAAAAGRIAGRLRVTAAVRVLVSARAQVPMVIGMIRPVVLMPASLLTGLTLQQVEAIIAHELAHVRRYDYAINLFQTIVETLFFFHPAVWWLSRRMRDEREQACDELAVSMCGGDPIFYSRVLLTVEEWRSARISFAPAATGGSLALRIRKLIGEDDRKLDVGPRWFAGVVTVAAALFATGSAVSDKAEAQSLEVVAEASNTQDTARARPASVTRFSGTGSLEDRWKWATETARNKKHDQFWIGYVVRGSSTSEWLYVDRGSPVQAGDSWFSGHMRFSGDFNNLKFSGVSLSGLVGDYSPNDHAIFLAFDASGRRTRLVRVRLANFVFPMHFNRWPLLWLDEVPGGESVRLLAGLRDEAATTEVMGDLPAAIGAHQDSRAVLPVLMRWVDDRSAPHDFRVEAVEALAYHGTPESLAMLTRLARSNEAEDLRAEAVEALGELALPAAADSLLSLARTLNTERLRAEAVESLGDRKEPQVAAWLEEIARTGDPRLRMEAIEAIADLPGGNEKLIIELAGDPALDLTTRMEAIEALGDLQDKNQALTALQGILTRERNTGLVVKATETLGDLEHPRAVEILRELLEKHESVEVQREAAETLGDVHDHAAALAELERVARTHRERSVRIEAIEAIGNFSDDGSGAEVLRRLVREKFSDEALTMAALEALAEAGEPREIAKFLDEFLRSDVSVGLKVEALEVLDELADDAGVPLLEKYARSDDMNLRAKAAELLVERKN
jgi:beta-lactamase regulating signal transducer with metallopeptidase domain/HEAT repeat protein